MRNYNSPIIFLSYPKCGRSWLFAILGKYLSIKHDMSDTHSIDFITEPHKFNLKPIKRIHAGFSYEDPKKYIDEIILKQSNVILMHRGIKDTIVSYYHDCKGRKGYKENISTFIRSNNGVSNIIDFYNRAGKCKIIDYFSYEDLSFNPLNIFQRFYNLVSKEHLDIEIAQAAVNFCSFKNLHTLERQKKFYMRGSKGFFKTRKGEIGSYKEDLCCEDINFINERIELDKKPNDIWKLLDRFE